jgi:hypothetical protein
VHVSMLPRLGDLVNNILMHDGLSFCCRRLVLPLVSKRWSKAIQSVGRWRDCSLQAMLPPYNSFKQTCILRSGSGLA